MDENDLVIPINDQALYYEAGYLALKALLGSLNSTTEKIVMSEFRRALADKELSSHINSGVMQYLYAAGFLSYCAKEINRENLKKVISAMGSVPDDKMIDIVLKLDMKSHLVYVYAYYFLVANGKDISEPRISELIEAIGMAPDKERIAEMLKFLK